MGTSPGVAELAGHVLKETWVAASGKELSGIDLGEMVDDFDADSPFFMG